MMINKMTRCVLALLEKIFGFFCNCKKSKKTNVTTMFYKGYRLANEWNAVNKDKESFIRFFDDNCIKSIAIYGFGEIGQRFYQTLKSVDVEVLYIIDRKVNGTSVDGIKLIGLNEKLDAVDAIIVTPVQLYDEIANELEMVTDMDIISLAEVVEYCV